MTRFLGSTRAPSAALFSIFPVLGLVVMGLSVMGCASGGAESHLRPDRDGAVDGSTSQDAEVGEDAGPVDECTPPCDEGDDCVDGLCVPGIIDRDGDGIPADLDCDDEDPDIGRMHEVPCDGPCGAGLERCVDGRWSECDAPLECECTAGSEPRELSCTRCGIRLQTCTEGMWVDSDECMGQGPCTPGQMETDGDCGNCGTARRECGSDCQWGAWACVGEGVCSPGTTDDGAACGCGGVRRRTCQSSCTWSAEECVGGGGGACTEGEMDTESRSCCGGGTQTRTRTCNASCSWGAFGEWSACSTGVCTPGATRACDQNSAGTDTACGVETCSASCTWGSCELAAGATCLSQMGTNFQCCTTTGGSAGWQYCNASTCNWFACQTPAGGGC